MSFEQTPEYVLSMAMRPACNRVLCHVFGIPESNIERFTKDDDLFVLDKEHGIDARVRLPNGCVLLGQEKTLDYKFYNFRTFTIEFWQNRYSSPQEPGEFFKIASQFYLHGYADQTGCEFIEWIIIDLFRFMIWLKDCPQDKLANRTKPSGPSRAAFLPIEYDKIPSDCIYAQWRRSKDKSQTFKQGALALTSDRKELKTNKAQTLAKFMTERLSSEFINDLYSELGKLI